jgi:hypothetical protein
LFQHLAALLVWGWFAEWGESGAHAEEMDRKVGEEREAIARHIDSMDKSEHPSDIAAAIRARGTK